MKRLAPIFGGIALVCLAIMGLGLALPGTWEAEQTFEFQQEPADLFPFLSDLARWEAWTVWSDFESVVSDPSAGPGATRHWDDANYGEGRVELVEVVPLTLVRYRVEIEQGSAWVNGEIVLSKTAVGTRVTWSESGDFGWNPLMGFMARRMPASQRMQMLEGLERLSGAFAEATTDGR